MLSSEVYYPGRDPPEEASSNPTLTQNSSAVELSIITGRSQRNVRLFSKRYAPVSLCHVTKHVHATATAGEYPLLEYGLSVAEMSSFPFMAGITVLMI